MLTNVEAVGKAVMVWMLRLPAGLIRPAALSDVLVIWPCSLALMLELCSGALLATAYDQGIFTYKLGAAHCWSVWKPGRGTMKTLVWQAMIVIILHTVEKRSGAAERANFKF